MGWFSGESSSPDSDWKAAKEAEDEARERRLDAEDERYKRYFGKIVLREEERQGRLF